MRMEDDDHNIGAYGNQAMLSDEEPAVSNNREDVACHVGGKAAPDTRGQIKGRPDTPGDRVNRVQSLQRFPGFKFGDAEGIRGFLNEGSLKARRKVEKMKQRKAAGWTKSDNLEGYKEFAEVGDVLDFLGEGEESENPLSAQQQKKKMKKKVKHKCSSKLESRNGRSSATSSTASDSDHENIANPSSGINRSSATQTPSMNGCLSSASRPSLAKDGLNSLTLSIDSCIQSTSLSDIGAIENGLNSQSAEDDEFKEVQRKKKGVHKQMEKGKPLMPAAVFRQSNKNDCRSHSAAAANQTKAFPSVESAPSMDSSLNSFPMLSSVRGSAYLEPTPGVPVESAADEDRESIGSQSASCNKKTWAKIAAKPSSFNSNLSSVTKSHALNTPLLESAAGSSSQHNRTSNEQLPCSSWNGGPPVKTHLRNGCTEIEFGTVTSSNDIGANRLVHDILSQSRTEGQTRFPLRSHKNVPNNTKITSTDNRKKLRHQKKPVVFLDRHPGQPLSNNSIVFCFGNNDHLDQENHMLSLKSQTIEHCLPTITAQDTVSGCTGYASSPSCSNISAQSECLENTLLPQAGDVLPHILSASFDESSYDKHRFRSSHNINGSFNLSDAVSMLKKEWNCVLEMRKRYGNGAVKFSAELLSN
ncbi:uncharacterized protein [Watersipora subatra]|uniref:uncharacterized protein isoform X2 n=1 Tax=Watersipora subatra TaxID=2589382 RepID=UPI00355BF9E8